MGALPVVTVAAGGMSVVDVTSTKPLLGMAVTEATNKFGIAVTKVANGLGVLVTFVGSAAAERRTSMVGGIMVTTVPSSESFVGTIMLNG